MYCKLNSNQKQQIVKSGRSTESESHEQYFLRTIFNFLEYQTYCVALYFVIGFFKYFSTIFFYIFKLF